MSQAPKGQPALKQEASIPQQNEEKVERNEELPANEAESSTQDDGLNLGTKNKKQEYETKLPQFRTRIKKASKEKSSQGRRPSKKKMQQQVQQQQNYTPPTFMENLQRQEKSEKSKLGKGTIGGWSIKLQKDKQIQLAQNASKIESSYAMMDSFAKRQQQLRQMIEQIQNKETKPEDFQSQLEKLIKQFEASKLCREGMEFQIKDEQAKRRRLLFQMASILVKRDSTTLTDTKCLEEAIQILKKRMKQQQISLSQMKMVNKEQFNKLLKDNQNQKNTKLESLHKELETKYLILRDSQQQKRERLQNVKKGIRRLKQHIDEQKQKLLLDKKTTIERHNAEAKFQKEMMQKRHKDQRNAMEDRHEQQKKKFDKKIQQQKFTIETSCVDKIKKMEIQLEPNKIALEKQIQNTIKQIQQQERLFVQAFNLEKSIIQKKFEQEGKSIERTLEKRLASLQEKLKEMVEFNQNKIQRFTFELDLIKAQKQLK